MPIYEFRCEECDREFETLVLSKGEEVHCPHCRGERVSRLMSVCALSTGDGFKSTASSSSCSGCTATSCAGCKP